MNNVLLLKKKHPKVLTGVSKALAQLERHVLSLDYSANPDYSLIQKCLLPSPPQGMIFQDLFVEVQALEAK